MDGEQVEVLERKQRSFEITFAPGEKTTYKVIPGDSNDDGAELKLQHFRPRHRFIQ